MIKWAAAIAVALLMGCAYAAGDLPLRSVISLEGEESVRFEISAVGEDVTFLSWGTPLETAFQERFLRIAAVEEERHGQWTSLAATVKRAAPSEKHFVTIAAGSSVSGVIAVADHYAIHEAGAYLLRLQFAVVRSDGTRATSVSNEVALHVWQPAERVVRAPRSVNAVFFNGCSASETSQINQAIVDATSSTEDALAYLDANGSCINDYTQWFGTYSSSRFSAVDGAFESILDQFESTDFGFDCTCNDPDTFAFVFISDPAFTIHLCDVFWNAPAGRGNINSQPGTLVHEMSHFTAVYGSEDFKYGVEDCTALAISNPSQAINNADSLEYFTESNPTCALSCGDDSCTGVEGQTCASDCGVSSESSDSAFSSDSSDSSDSNSDSSGSTFSADSSDSSYSSDSSNGSSGGNDDSASTALAGSYVAALVACLVMAL